MQTDFGSLTTMQKRLWSVATFQAGRDKSFWMGTKGLMGEGTKDATKPVHLVTELTETEKGDRCVLPLVQDLQNDGIVGDNQLEGNEEALVVDDIEIKIDQFRNGVKSRGRMSEQRTVLRFRVQAKDKLAFWLGDKVDEILFLTASGVSYGTKLNGAARAATSQLSQLAFAADVSAPSTNRVLYAGTATSTATLTSSDKMSWNFLVRMRTHAEVKKIKPIRVGGRDTYCVVMHSYQRGNLVVDNDYKTAVGGAGARGDANPLFTGMFADVDGLVLYSHNKVKNTLGLTSGVDKWGAGATLDGAQCLLLGAQALGFARIGEASWGESDVTDYQNRSGIGYGRMIGAIKTKFKSIEDGNSSEDFSIVSGYTTMTVG